VLDRLEKVRRSGRNHTALCPAHDDRGPSLSVTEGDDGRVLLFCHAGCSVDQIASALRLELRELFPPRGDTESSLAKPERRPYALPGEAAERMLRDPSFAPTWGAAWALARLPGRAAEREVLLSWRWVADRYDVRLLLETATTIRGIAVLRFANPQALAPRWSEFTESYVESGELSRAVERLERYISRRKVAAA
jgi:hypothetical protein